MPIKLQKPRINNKSAIATEVTNKLYSVNPWANFVPSYPKKEVHGWNGNHPALKRLALNGADATGANIIVDVGVWLGSSVINMASELKNNKINGCVIAVDTFLGSPEHWSMENYFDRVNGFPNLYQQFLTNIYNAELTEYVIPLPQTSISAAMILKAAGIAPNVVHVDAAHEYPEVLKDIEAYYELLPTGGCLIGDDYDPTWPGVIQAANEFAAKQVLYLEVESPKFILRKR